MASLPLHLARPSVFASAAEVENPLNADGSEVEVAAVEIAAVGNDVGWMLEFVCL